MSNLTWNEGLHSHTSKLIDAPASARSVWQTIAAGLGVWLYWEGSGGAASSLSRGEPKPGMHRTFVERQSRSSFDGVITGDQVGRMYTTVALSGNTFVNEELWAYDAGHGSAYTVALGTGALIEHMVDPKLGHSWVMNTGSYQTNSSSGSTLISRVNYDTGDGIAARPMVFACASDDSLWCQVEQRDGEVYIHHYDLGGFDGSTQTITWFSLNTVVQQG